MTYDLIIIGGGPAGTAAAVYASRKNSKLYSSLKNGAGNLSYPNKFLIGSVLFLFLEQNLLIILKNHVLANVGDSLEVKEDEKR